MTSVSVGADGGDAERRLERPWVKICGVTRPEDAALAVRLGADFVGVNFWPRSRRFVELAAALEIAFAVGEARAASDDGAAELVGVFVNEDPGRIDELAGEVGLDRIQLHGDESDDVVERFGQRALRALRAEGRVAELVASAAALDSRARADDGAGTWNALVEESGLSIQWNVFALLLDSPAGSRFGGTGESWEWGRAKALIARSPTPILIAGGVDPGNAAEVLLATGAAGVDVASGVESAPGIKDREKMERLFEEVARVRRIA